MSIEKKVKDILIEKFAVVPDDDKDLIYDLNLDSLDIIELQMCLEKEFNNNRSIEDPLPSQSMTVAQLIDYVKSKAPVNKPVKKPIAGLYTTSSSGKAKCCLTGENCTKISKDEIHKNTQLFNLCRSHNCIIERNFQQLKQYTK